MLAMYGSWTILQNPMATAASMALPPAFNIERPASADSGKADVTIPFSATTSSLFTFQALYSDIIYPLA